MPAQTRQGFQSVSTPRRGPLGGHRIGSIWLLLLGLTAIAAMAWAPSALADAAATDSAGAATTPVTPGTSTGSQPSGTQSDTGSATDPGAGTGTGTPSTPPATTDPVTGGTGTGTQTSHEAGGGTSTPTTGSGTTQTGGTTAGTASGAGGTTSGGSATTSTGSGATGSGATGSGAATTPPPATADVPAATATAPVLPARPDLPPAAAPASDRVTARPDVAPAPAARPDAPAPLLRSVLTPAVRRDAPDLAGTVPVRRTVAPALPGGPDAHPVAPVHRHHAPKVAAPANLGHLATLAQQDVITGADPIAEASHAGPRHRAAQDPVTKKIAPALGAPKDAPRLSAIGVDAFATLPPLSGQSARGSGGLLQILAGYFVPSGGTGPHLLLLVELALLGGALTWMLFSTPLLRLVIPDGRRRAGYQAVALRPG